MHFPRFRTTAIAAVCAAALALGGCSDYEPRADYISDPEIPITIAARVDRPDHIVMATLYQRALRETGYEATLRVVGTPGEDVEAWFKDPDVDLFTACTGSMLVDTAPQLVDPLLEELYGDNQPAPAGGEESQKTHFAGDPAITDAVEDPGDVASAELTLETLAGTLPKEFETTDPSPTHGCQYETGYSHQDELPQNLVAIYRKVKFDRYAQDALSVIVRLITAEDLEELVEKTQDPATLREVVNTWFDENVGRMEKSPQAQI